MMRKTLRAASGEQIGIVLVVLLVVAAELWLAFHAGSFFAGTTAAATIAAGLALVVWIIAAPRPLDGLSRQLAVAVGAIALFAVWQMYSQRWSHAPAAATIEFDRTLLYAFVALLAGLVATTDRRRKALLIGIWASMTVTCASGLISRLLPSVWSTAQTVQPDRLGYPVSYWNALGLIGVITLVASLHFASDVRERLWFRAVAIAVTPVLLCTVLLTFSRASIAMLIVAVPAYLALARPRGAVAALAAAVPAAAAAGIVAFTSDAVVSGRKTDAAISQGRGVAIVVLGCAVLATCLFVLLRRTVEPRIVAAQLDSLIPRRPLVTALVVMVALAGIAVGMGAPGWVGDKVSAFASAQPVIGEPGNIRARLSDVGNNGRLRLWEASMDAFKHDPVTGSGAGTFANDWVRYRTGVFDVNDGHSLLIETLGELGLVGAALILISIITILIGGAQRIRGPNRGLYAALFVIVLVWAIRAQADWDWEMPVLTAPVIACGGAVLGGTLRRNVARTDWPPRLPRLLGAIAVLLVLLTPLAIARSQRTLDAAATAARAKNCDAAITQALSSIDAMSSRPEPFQILALCDLHLQRNDLAIGASRAAIRRDPNAWTSHYYLAVTRAAHGLDPRPALRDARRLNPLSYLLRYMTHEFDSSRPSQWPNVAAYAPLPY